MINNHIRNLPEGVTLEDFHGQMREECAELIQASDKLERIRRGTNPSPMTEDVAYENLVEEIADVVLTIRFMMQVEGISEEYINSQCEFKYQRWLGRCRHENS